MLKPGIKVNQSGRLRDQQRQRVYKAEECLKKVSKRFNEIKDVKALFEQIFNADWFKQQFPKVQNYSIGDGRRRRKANGYSYGHNNDDGIITVRVNLPRWSRWEFIILHEIAHGLQPRNSSGHGKEFCGIYLWLVSQVMSEEAYLLLWRSFGEHNIKCQLQIGITNEL